MEITHQNNDNLTIEVVLKFGKEDYAEKRKKNLNNFRKTADIRGFRKGMAPMSLIEKMHGSSALADAINDLISESLNNFIQEQNLSLIGEPLPSETNRPENNWESGEDFSFVFDLALAPKVELSLDKEDKIVYYDVKIAAKAKKEYRSNLLKQCGKLENTDVVKEESFIIADLIQEENSIEGTYISMKTIEDKDSRELFTGKTSGDEFEIDVVKAFPNEADRASLLRVKKEELSSVNPKYKVIIKEVKDFVDAEPTQEVYDRLFGPGVVTTEEQFDKRVEERLKTEYAQESDYRFMLDTRDYLINKCNINLPEDFMKRWLYVANDGKFTMEDIEKEFDLFAKDFRWQLISGYIMREQNLKITKEQLIDQAKKLAAYQFAMYGLNNVPDEQLNSYAESILTNEKEGRRIQEKVEEDLVITYVRSVVTLDKKKISIEELHKLTN